jgi:DNA polymerase-3 subunit beta
MKITVSKEDLASAIRRVMSAISARPIIPVLSNIHIQAKENRLYFKATDLEISVRTSVAALVEEEGSTTLPARKFQQIVSALQPVDITIQTDEEDRSRIVGGKANFLIHGLSASQYPTDDEFTEDWSLKMAAKDVVGNMEKVAYARSSDDTRKQLNGILFSIRSGILTIAATDGRRLALVERVLEQDCKTDGDVILPSKTVSELIKNMSVEGEMTIRLSQAKVMFETADTAITTKLVEGTYPNFRQVIPNGFNCSVKIPRVKFSEALNRVATVVSESNSAVRMSLEKDSLLISAQSQEYGEASEPVDVLFDGEPMVIAFNPDFFNDPLKYLTCDQLELKYNDELSPVELTGDEGFIYIIMPMRN